MGGSWPNHHVIVSDRRKPAPSDSWAAGQYGGGGVPRIRDGSRPSTAE
jgi:hypothetical protein